MKKPTGLGTKAFVVSSKIFTVIAQKIISTNISFLLLSLFKKNLWILCWGMCYLDENVIPRYFSMDMVIDEFLVETTTYVCDSVKK